jgi:uncharacterized protein YndB with AHSA1/START domain
MPTDPLSGSESQITLTRTIDAPVDDVFAAFTDPALLEQWQADEVDVEPFEGGRYRYVTEGDEDEPGPHEVSGEYLEFVENKRLKMSWVYKAPEDADEAIYLVEIDFKRLPDDRTSITITESGASHADAESRIFSIEAWSAAIEHLADLIE